ncbi:MAG: Ca-activated chloride channel [Pseudomonadota bacterium]|jgi:Ca-activated chloride channel family protein|nr:VWA domain-containing protein [Burkholderiales bacterium]MBP9769390.1 VWA domain-containing protein [Burkholderiales bacterium]MDQ5948194.1 Ca-activated chloride channel [Pseudomonadota bacterium]HCY39439.1 hypothetical protein [Neisseriales bacterium]
MLSLFHFLRPWWLLALIPAIMLSYYWYKKSQTSKNSWQQHCDPHLLEHLLVKQTASKNWGLITLLMSGWLVIIVALAGPTWSRYAAPVYQKNLPRVIVLDVSQSMNATDLAPSRLQRAKYKVLDLLHSIKEGQTGMLVFSSLPFVVSPLTSDSNTIASMVPILDSSIVPVQGVDIGKALQKAGKLLQQAGSNHGQIILVTDNTPTQEDLTQAHNLAQQGYTTSVLAIATEQDPALVHLAGQGDGEYLGFKNDNSDVTQLINSNNSTNLSSKSSTQAQTEDLWDDHGSYLIWLAVFLLAFLARKGWLDKLC